MTDRNIKVGVEVDASDAKKGMNDLGVAAQDMSRKVKKAGEEAGQGLGKVGEGSEQASEKIDRTSKSIIQSIQRTTVALESGGRTTAKYYETIANQRGVSVDALRPYLEQLKAVETAQGKFTQASGSAVTSLNKVGISAKQTAAAMRNVPAQFTDIVVSLQAGQAPLTVFLQQGGQLKDMFGGAGNAAKALGGYLVGLVNPFTILAVAAGGVAFAYAKGSKEASEFAKSIILTGNAAGTTTNELIQITEKLNAVGAGSIGLIAESLNTLISSGKLSSGILEEATMAAVGAQKILGIAVADTAKEFANLSKAPSAGLLNLVANYQGLTIEVYRQVKALEEQGRTSEAAILAQSSYARVLTDQKDAVENTLGRWERGWNRLKDATAGAIDKISEVGRETSRVDQLTPLLEDRRRLNSARANLGNTQGDSYSRKAIDNQLSGLNATIKALVAEEKASVLNAAAQDTANKKRLAGVEVEKLLEAALTKTEQKKIAIAKAEAQFAIADTKESERKKILASIEEKYADKSIKSIKEKAAAWDFQSFNIDKAGKIQTKALSDIDKSISAIKFPNPLKEITAEFEKQTASFVKINAGLDEYAIGLQGQNELAQLELSLIGQSATERGILIEQHKIELALQKEIRKIKAEIKDVDAAQILIDKATSNAEIEKSQAAIKVQQQEWSKFYDDIYNGLTDSLYRGFESGKGFGKSFIDSLKNLFKTNVLKIAVQAVMGGATGTLSSMAQAFGGESGGSSGGVGSYISMGKSIYEGFSSGFSGFGNSVATYVQAGLDKAGLSMTSGGNSAFASGAGTAASYAGGAAVGIYGGRAISGGYSVTGGNAAVNIGTAIGAIWGPIGMAIGGAIGGLVNRAFGRKADELQQSELSGSFGGAGFSGSVRDVYKAEGGWFSGDKWSEKVNPVGDTKSLTDAFMSIKSAASGYASILGLSAESLNNFSKDFKVNLSITGDAAKDAAANEKIMTDLIIGLSNDISTFLAPELSKFAKEGEQAAATMARLSNSLLTVNGIMSSVGITEFAKSLEGASAAERLAELTGGIEKLATGAQYFFENFLTDAEKIKPSVDLVSSTMSKLGQSSVDTVEEFKTLVQGLDLSTQAGAEMYAALIAIAPQFKAVADFAKQSAEEIKKAEEEIKKAEEEKTKVIQQGNADRAALLADRRAADLAQEAIKKASDDAFKTLTESVTSGMKNLIRAGDAGAAVASQMSISGIKTSDFATSSGYNSAAAAEQAKIAKGLMGSASFDALNVQDVSRFMSGLMSFIFADDVQNSIKSELAKSVNLPEQGLIGQTIADLLTAEARDYTNKNMLARGSGIAGVMAAQLDLSFASYHGRGADVEAYNTAVIGLSDLLKGGKITQDEYATSLASVNKLVGDSIGLMRDESAQRERVIGAQNALKEAGISSIAFYFEQIGKSVEELNKVAAETAAPLSQVTSAIGRLTSIADVFGMSANAAGGKESGITSVANAQLVASAASIAAGVITSADAAQAAKLLADKTSFAGVNKTSIRDISLIFEGLKQFDAKSFENSFMRMNDALNKGAITQEQYQDIFDQSLNTYQGLDASTKAVADAMEGLRKSMGGFADQLLIDKQKTTLTQAATMDELLRQYEVAKVAAMTGEASSVNKFQDLANQVLDVNKYGSRAEYNAAFGAVYRDARNLESIGARSAQGENVVSELKNLNKSQTERIDKLEDSLLAALVQIAKNTKDTVNTLELAEIP